MIAIEHVDYHDERAVRLRAAMDIETSAVYADVVVGPDLEARLTAAFTVDPATIVETILVLDDDGRAIAHGALRPFGEQLEVKRIVVDAAARGRGVARVVMAEMERLALARGIHSLILQTGDRQLAAIALYESIGYTPTPVYGAYVGVPFAVCFEKRLDASR